MSDRIQKLKNESRRLPKNPNQSAGGARRVSHGIIGVRKVRRSSGKSNTSNGSRSANPFSDLVPHQSRSSVSSRAGDKLTGSPQLERRARRSRTSLLEKAAEEHTESLSRSQSKSINNILASTIANHSSTTKYSAIQSPRIPEMQTFEHLDRPTSLERDIPIQLDLRDSNHKSSMPSLEDGFVQQDDEQAMENMAMDKIDRFLESLGSESSHAPVLPPILPAAELKDNSLTAALKSTIGTKAISPETQKLVMKTPEKKPAPQTTVQKVAKSPEVDGRSIHSWITTSADEEELKSPSVASTPSIRPLSIVKSPTNTGFGRNPGPSADPDETFRGVKVAWLIEMYHDYMAEKSRRADDPEEQAVLVETDKVEKVSPSAKGLRPLLLPTVVATTETPAKTTEKPSTKSADGASAKRPMVARGLTFGAPRTPIGTSQKGSTTSSSGGHSKSPPTLQRSVTGLVSKDPKPTPPPFKRTVTGLTQKDAVEVARTKMNAALEMQSDHFIDQVIEATALLSPTRSTFRDLDADERAIAKQHVSPVRDTFSSPRAYSPPTFQAASPPSKHSSPESKHSSPTMSALLPALAHENEPIIGSSEPSKTTSQKRPPKLNLAKADERKCIVTNNVAFFDPFASTMPRPASPVSPTLSEANLRMNRQFLEGINSMDTGLASSLGTRVAAKLSPPLIHGESGLKNVQLQEAESAKTSISEGAASQKDAAAPAVEQDLPLMLQEDSTSEDDELLPKLKPRFEGLGVSSKAQKLLGMSEARKAVKSRAAKTEYPMSRPTNTETNKLYGRATAPVEMQKALPVSKPERSDQLKSAHAKHSSTGKTLVEPFDEAKYTSQLSKSLAEQAPRPEVVKVKSKTSQQTVNAPVTGRAANANFDRPKSTGETKDDSANTGLISIKFGDSVPVKSTTQNVQARPRLVSQGSSEYPQAKLTTTSARVQSVNAQPQKALPIKKANPAPQSAPVTKAAQQEEPKTYGPFANYRINQEVSPSNITKGQASMSPSNTGPALSPTAAQPKSRETGFRVSPTSSRSPPSPQDVRTPTEQPYKKPSVYYDSPSPEKHSPSEKHSPPAKDRKVSRGKHGRLSVIEHAPMERNAKGQVDSVHGLGLGMSPTAPAPAHVFEQILHSEKGSRTRPVASRSSTLDRINKSATPTMSKSGSSADGRSEHSIDQLSSHRRTPSDHQATVKTAVPISYYQPRNNKDTLDPFRNLDMKTVTAPRKTSHEQKARPVTIGGYFAAPRESQLRTSGIAGSDLGPIADRRSDSTSETSITDVERNYTTRVADLAPDLTLSPRTSAPRNMLGQAPGQLGSSALSQQQQQQRKARPATMMAAREVHEKFDIRRALARSDDGEDEYDSAPAKTYDAPEEVFGAFANTATQAFSKWFG